MVKLSTTTSLVNNNFGGIRRKDAYFSDEKITCSDCQNVELFYTELNSGVGIRTTSGNTKVTSLIPEDEEVINMFESIQDGNNYFFVYTESETKGRIYNLDIKNETLNLIVDNLSVTGNACGVDFTQGWLDMFVFSNGINVKYIYTNTETHSSLTVESDSNIVLKDPDNRAVSGLGLVNFDNRIWLFKNNVLWYSQQAECRNFQYNDTSSITSAGYIEFVKPITAICPYLGSLAVFHKDSSVLVTVDSTTGFAKEDESPGGCASYDSLVFHGTDLYFYDDTKKGVFSFKQIINGDKTLGDNIALDIQDELLSIKSGDVNKIKTLSVITSDRNEIWFLIPISTNEEFSYIMIYDYLRGEWVKRKSQHINCVSVVDSVLYSGGKQVYQEYNGKDFDGTFIESYYKCTSLNLGSDNTMKMTKFPPRLTINTDYICNFGVQYIKNYKQLRTPKVKKIKAKTIRAILYYDSGQTYDSEYIYASDTINSILKLPSISFKTLEITLFTEKSGEAFAIEAIEFNKIKVKQV